ncbi:MAG: hypothetical protein J6L81_09230 [Clostridia bacterium]|nr:hypothetical protein [Clostridia bacterium]
MKNTLKKVLAVFISLTMMISCFAASGCYGLEFLEDYEYISDSDVMSEMEDEYTDDEEEYADDEEEYADDEEEEEEVPEDEEVPELPDGKFRKHYTKIKGGGKDEVTVMVYMCGSNLESDSGFATSDIKEMLKADYSDKVNILIETGGARKWHASSITDDGSNISTKKNQVWQVMENDITLIDETDKREPMTDPDTLLDFIDFCTEEYPANRYMLILWDHGDGAVGGFGYDEHYESGTLTIDGIQQALKKSGVKFDFVGYDACLMGMMEVAYMMYDYVDYFIASEDYEPAAGWEYENWLQALSDNTSISTEKLGKIIVDDYVKECGRSDGILSVCDLVYAKYVYAIWCEFAYANEETLLTTDYAWETEASNRLDVKNRYDWTDLFFYSEESHIIDMLAVARTIESEQSEPLLAGLKTMIVYSNATSSTEYSASYMTGLAVALPYGDSELYSEIKEIFPKCGFDDEYVEFLGKFVDSESAPNNDEIWEGWDDIWNGWDSWDDFLNYEWGEWGSLSDYLGEDWGAIGDYLDEWGLYF